MTATAIQGASQTATGAPRLGTHAGIASTPISRQGSRLGGIRRSISTTQLVAGSPFGHGASSSNGLSRQGSAVEQMGVLQPGLSVAAINRQSSCGPLPSLPDDGSDDAPHASAFPQRASPRLRLGVRRVASAASLLSPAGVMAAATLAAAAEELGVTPLSSSLTGRPFSQGSRLQRNNTSAAPPPAPAGDCATTIIMATGSSGPSRPAPTAGDTGPADGSSREAGHHDGEEDHDGLGGSQAADASQAANGEGVAGWSMDQLLASGSGAAGACLGVLGEDPLMTSAHRQTTECVPWATGGIPEQLLELELMLPDPCMGGESAKRSQPCYPAAFKSITRPPRRTNSRLAINAGAAGPLLEQTQCSLPSRAESRRRLTQLDAEGGSISQGSASAAEDAASLTGTANKGCSEGGLVRGLSGVRRQLSRAALGSSSSQRMFSTAGASSSGKGLGDSGGGILSRSGSSSGMLGSATSSLCRRPAHAAPKPVAGAGAQEADEPTHASNTLPVQASGAYSPSVPPSQAAAASQVMPSRTTTSSSGSSRSSTRSSSTGGSESALGTVLPVSTTYPDSSADSLQVPEDGAAAAGGEYTTQRYGSWRRRLPEPPGPLDVDAAAPALEGRQLRQNTSGDITYVLGRWGSRWVGQGRVQIALEDR